MRTEGIRVVMVSYNGELYFDEQLNSIEKQDHLEKIYISDDASEELFSKRLDLLSQRGDSRISISQNSKNIGLLANIKKAIAENLDAEFIALSDQDDIWKGNKLALLYEMAIAHNEESPLLIYHDAEVIDKNGKSIHPSFWKFLGHDHYQHRLETFLYGNFITGGNTLINKTLARKANTIPEDLQTLHDAWLGLCAFVFGKVIKIDQQLNQYRFHGENLAFKRNPSLKKRTRINHNTFLSPEFEMIERFMSTFEGEIPSEKEKILTEFLALKEKPYLIKRLKRFQVLHKFKKR